MAIQYDYGTGEYRNWIVAETEFNTEHLGKFETIFCLGNGYMGVRAATEEHYLAETEGFFVAGLFDQFQGEVTELPNLPDWLGVEITLNGERFDLEKGNVYNYNRRLNVKDGELVREVEWESPGGSHTRFVFRRCVSMQNLHLAGLKIEIEPLNDDADVEIRSGFDGQVTNSGVQHFVEGDKRIFRERNLYYMTARTQESHIDVILAARHRFSVDGTDVETRETFRSDRRQIFLTSTFKIKKQNRLIFEKFISVYTGRDQEFAQQNATKGEVREKALAALERDISNGYDSLFEHHKMAWCAKWEVMDVEIEGPDFDQLALRFAQYHLIQMTPAHDSRFSIAAKGLSGEGYKGHVFWDTEIFILPFFIYTFPETARKLLEYRYHTLEGARKKAKENGCQGAMYAWESAFSGEETTPKWGAIDIETGEPIRIWTGELAQHIVVDVVYGIWRYFQVTRDIDFMLQYGFEIFFDTATFWASRLEYNREHDRYEIHDVIGPDEYSEHVDNNAYTNYMAQWHLRQALDSSKWLKANHPNVWKRLHEKIEIEKHQPEWEERVAKIYFAVDQETGIIPQYNGFMEKKIIDLSPYRGKVGAIHQDYSWEEINKSQVLKQTDVVMLFYLLGDRFSTEIKRANWDFYEPKTLHDSSLSPAIHSILANDMGEPDAAYQYFERTCRIDLSEDMHSCDAGLHAASLGGLWQAVVNGFAGIRIHKGRLRITPYLPENWNTLRFQITWRGDTIKICIDKKQLSLKKEGERNTTIALEICGNDYELAEKELVVDYGDI